MIPAVHYRRRLKEFDTAVEIRHEGECLHRGSFFTVETQNALSFITENGISEGSNRSHKSCLQTIQTDFKFITNLKH